ncbi:hypothetical protein M378DRAFT_381916 [Amanita muscaria Koide BX008]|uniref:Uncharacterized protein n=1 Tax=Amanita muscaria (strain Koide BX008) TaxID=946122 RepID=A0A0C2WMS0_AMAMK|nr:hypothetical protein M378DRAFT_381916 [Amanita muscaria Koide BX008]
MRKSIKALRDSSSYLNEGLYRCFRASVATWRDGHFSASSTACVSSSIGSLNNSSISPSHHEMTTNEWFLLRDEKAFESSFFKHGFECLVREVCSYIRWDSPFHKKGQ